MYVQKEYFSIFFGFNSSPNTIKQLDATSGSRRGAVLQQNSDSAHRPKIKVFLTRLQSRRGPEHNRWSSHLCMNVQKEYLSIFFRLNLCPNTIKQLDATFGSRRWAVLQQNSESAHRTKIKVSLTGYQVGAGLDPIDGVHTLAGMWKKNKFPFFFGLNSSPNAMKQLDATFGSRRGDVLRQNPESAHRLKLKVPLSPKK